MRAMATAEQQRATMAAAVRPLAADAPTFAEFFAGIGLMWLGLERAGWRIAFANDIDPKKLEMYRAAFPDAEEHFLLKDVHALSAEELPTVDLATASFPCTDLSLAGAREGLRGKQSSAFWGFIRASRSWASVGRRWCFWRT